MNTNAPKPTYTLHKWWGFFLNTDIKGSIIKEQDKTEYRPWKVNVNQNKVFRDVRSWFEVEFGNKAGN